MKTFLALIWFILFLSPAKLLEEAVAEAAAEAEVVEEEEEAQDDNFSSCNSYQVLSNFSYFLYRSCLLYAFLINWNVKRCLSFVSKAWRGRQRCPVSRAVADYTDLGCHCHPPLETVQFLFRMRDFCCALTMFEIIPSFLRHLPSSNGSIVKTLY